MPQDARKKLFAFLSDGEWHTEPEIHKATKIDRRALAAILDEWVEVGTAQGGREWGPRHVVLDRYRLA